MLYGLHRGYLQILVSFDNVRGLRFNPNDDVMLEMVKATFKLTSLDIKNPSTEGKKLVQGVRLSTFLLTTNLYFGV